MLDIVPDRFSVLSNDLCVLVGALLFLKLLDPLRPLDRALFTLTSWVFMARYVAWRWYDTMPPLTPSVEGLWPYVFFAFEIPALLSTFMSMIVLLRHSDRSAEADAAAAQREISGDWPAVDIVIPTYNESFEILETTIVAAMAIDYPSKTVWVLDDGRRSWLEARCVELGARYLARSDNIGAKAGNLNNGLRRTAALTNAPLILVLDADFVCHPNILRRTVGMLDAPQVAVVQTPPFYYNADPIQHNLMVHQLHERSAGSRWDIVGNGDCTSHSRWVDDQRMFFDIFQPAKDAWGCAFCVGTGFVVRRQAVNEIGGFPSEAITEDLNLTYKLLTHGYETRWLNERLCSGLSAEGVPEFISQRSRWCLGTIQVALLKSGPIFGTGYTFTQRWHFLHGIIYWLSKPFMALLLLAPSIYWATGLMAISTDYLSFLHYALPALTFFWTYSFWISRARVLPFFAEVTDSIAAFTISLTLASAVVKPFGRPFNVTNKGGDRSQPRIRAGLALLFGSLVGLNAASILSRLDSLSAVADMPLDDLFNVMWAGVSLSIAFVAFVVCFERGRHDHMFEREEETEVSADGRTRSCVLSRMSTSRACLDHIGGPSLATGDRLDLAVPRVGWIPCEVVESAKDSAVVRLLATAEQRRRMIALLYASGTKVVECTARLHGAVKGLLKRCFGADVS